MSMTADGALATQIANGLIDGATGEAGAVAMGQLLSAIGLDPGGESAVSAELGEIVAQLSALETAIADLRNQMMIALTRIDYDTLAQGASDLISTNLAAARRLQDYTQATDEGERSAIKAAIVQMLNEAQIDQAPEKWQTILCGSGGGTGLLEAWNRLVRANHPVFGPAASQALQQHWQYFDAQQALSISHCVELLHAADDGTGGGAVSPDVQRVYDSWRANRGMQLQTLRGMMAEYYGVHADYADQMDWIVAGQRQTVMTPMKVLPQRAVIVEINGQLLMCYMVLRGPITRGTTRADAMQMVMSYAIDAGFGTGVGGDDSFINNESDFGPYSFIMRGKSEMVAILNALGGAVGQDQDRFADALQAMGFTNMPGGQLRLWADGPVAFVPAHEGNPPRDEWAPAVFVEGASWWNPSTNPQDSAMLMLVRNMPDSEAANYWYED